MDLLRSAPLNVVLVMNVEENSPVRAQSIIRSLRDAGHHIILFGKLSFIAISDNL